jgi:hypothetical protein
MEKENIICLLSTKEECDYRSSYDRNCNLKSRSKYVVQTCDYQHKEKHSPDYKEPGPPKETIAQQNGEPF